MLGLAALALSWALATPLPVDAAAADKALAAELLSEPDAAARERWLAEHRPELTPGLAREIAAQSRALAYAGRFDPAREGYSLLLRLAEINGDPESRILGLEGQGLMERLGGRAQEALPLLDRAMHEAEAVPDRHAVGRLLGSIGTARRMLGEYGAALELFERQLAVFEALGDPEWQGWGHNNIGTALGSLGRYAEAVPHFEQSAMLFRTAGRTAAVAAAYNNLGICHRELGNYAAALEALQHSLELQQAAEDRPDAAATLETLGGVYAAQGAPLRALDAYRRGFAIAAEIGQKHYMEHNLGGEGVALLDLGRHQEARAAFEKSRALAEEVHDLSTLAWLSAYLAQIQRDLGDRTRALQLLEAGLKLAEGAEDVTGMLRTRRSIAALRLDEGQAAEALELAQRAAEMARRNELREELWPSLLVAGRANRALGHAGAAEAALREAVEVVEELRARAVGPDSDRAAFLVPHAAPYQELVSLLADGGRPWDALAVAERSKGRVLLDVLAGGRTSIGPALSPAEKAEERRLEGDVLTSNSELRALLDLPHPAAARREELEGRRTSRRLALEDWRARQYAAHPELRVLRGESRPFAPEDVASLVGDGSTVLLEYVLCERHAYLFALSAGSSSEPARSVRRLDLDSGEIVRLARDLRGRLAARDMDFAEPAARLYRALLSPARDVLRRARRVVIVPDGPLWELPFQALRPREGRFLIEDLAVSYAPSLSVLRDMQARQRTHARPDGALLALEPLPGTETQARAIARLYEPRAAAVRVGAEARESWLKAEAAHYRILHLATHGVLDDAGPLYSQLVLAPPAADDHDDGLLEAREILELDLGADLAVLSACETGRGRAGAGEGLIGMTWAFFVAGCPTTVASQWKVEAASTSRLMLAFHRELQGGHSPAEALRLAALAQLQRKEQRHPFYWAGFVAVGDACSSLPF